MIYNLKKNYFCLQTLGQNHFSTTGLSLLDLESTGPLFIPFSPTCLHLKLLKMENSKLCVSNQSCRLLADIVLSVANSFIHFCSGLYILKLIKLFLVLSTKSDRSFRSRSLVELFKFKCLSRDGKTNPLAVRSLASQNTQRGSFKVRKATSCYIFQDA